METAISTDGTSIAYDTFGSGPGLILIAGAMTDRSYYVPLATALSSAFTVVTYDRRGRGDSGDKQAVRSTVDALPAAEIRELPGEFHSPSPEALVPALKDFYLG